MDISDKKTAIIIGAGPAGLTAAYELLQRTDIIPIILEMSGDIGGISKTVNYKGNRIDIGGHRFFSKSDRVMDWWQNILSIHENQTNKNSDAGSESVKSEEDIKPDIPDRVFIIRQRLSRIFYLRQFFDYPVKLNYATVSKLGIIRIIKIGISYFSAKIFPRKEEKTLEDFFINRFGKELYKMFFKDYTAKVWGASCDEIGAEWGSQRIKGLSVFEVMKNSVRKLIFSNKSLGQKNIETSLIEQFLYPKFGPGQIWEEVAEIVRNKGGKILLNHKVKSLNVNTGSLSSVEVENQLNGEVIVYEGDYFFSSMPVCDLIRGMGDSAPAKVKDIAKGLVYRDFITVGLLLKKLKVKNDTKLETYRDLIPDNWIYIQEKDVKVGRIQVFNNWSPYMVKDINNVWLGLEYFCNEGDDFWNMSDESIRDLAVEEMAKINMIDVVDVLDSVVIRMQKTYPAYLGSYNNFDEIINFTDSIENLFLVGRNGMHKYNNQDHSMLTAMIAVENIINGVTSKDNIWEVNTEREYHEKK